MNYNPSKPSRTDKEQHPTLKGPGKINHSNSRCDLLALSFRVKAQSSGRKRKQTLKTRELAWRQASHRPRAQPGGAALSPRGSTGPALLASLPSSIPGQSKPLSAHKRSPCPKAACRLSQDGTILTGDRQHITDSGNERLGYENVQQHQRKDEAGGRVTSVLRCERGQLV